MITVTLTTDWGTDGIYTGAFKGRLVQRIPGVQMVDVTHNADSLNPIKIVYALKNCYGFFAKKTIHVVGVGGVIGTDAKQTQREFICFEYNHHYFIGPNNGMWETMFGEIPTEVFKLEKTPAAEKFNSFPELEVYIEAISKLALGMQPKHVGEKTDCAYGRRIGLPARKYNELIGAFQYMDSYSNGITNITKEEFYDAAKGRNFKICVGSERIEFVTDFIAQDYTDGDGTKIIALFSFTGFLEICVPQTKLSKFLHIDKNTKILVRFFEDGEEEEKEKEEGSLF